MDFNVFNGLYTLFLIVIFIGIFIWAYSKKNKSEFEKVGRSIFDDEPKTTEYESDSSQHTGVKK